MEGGGDGETQREKGERREESAIGEEEEGEGEDGRAAVERLEGGGRGGVAAPRRRTRGGTRRWREDGGCVPGGEKREGRPEEEEGGSSRQIRESRPLEDGPTAPL